MEQWENRNVCLQAAECQSKRHAHGRGDEQGNDQGRGRQCRHGRDHKLTCGHGRHRSGQRGDCSPGKEAQEQSAGSGNYGLRQGRGRQMRSRAGRAAHGNQRG